MGEQVVEKAGAKINLALHVTGRRADGYHLLDSLVTFAGHGDDLSFAAATEDQFLLSGRFASLLADEPGNLVLTARDRLRQWLTDAGQAAPPVRITLAKALPVASGIGGGSADAAAALRGLMRVWNATLPEPHLSDLALSLGADVPMCLAGRPAMVRGIGEQLSSVALPAFAMVLVNPLIAVSTPEVFRSLTRRDNPPVPALPSSTDPRDWIASLKTLRNDLQAPAQDLVPEIAETCRLLEESGALLARMSGSGATCFGIYPDMLHAEAAAARLATAHPGAYIQATKTLAGETP
ncbi:4-(cytidine 5'-diphospho)-2-C-methyl-D-erythritol kinase [Rhizobium sp. SAFR-030]|uniref:4-(cytidine 5'-diphospho)-2-C-methyl-D-erythritol kinase n=1 Tax=Rhizobium sp. SAFR-030 TaxID=3387277 RepID=UPI003F7E0F26